MGAKTQTAQAKGKKERKGKKEVRERMKLDRNIKKEKKTHIGGKVGGTEEVKKIR